MFDLKNIKFVKNDDEYGRRNYSFVGIQRSRDNKEQLEFWLPLGFKEFNHEDFDEVKSFFFKMYKTFRVYLKKKESQLKIEAITSDRDGIIEKEGGFSFTKENKAESLFYGKLNSLEKIMEGYDELRISALEKKSKKSNEIDYSKLHRYLHQAIYLEDDVVYLDEMNIAKSVIVKSSPPILQLFCFLYTEIKIELQEQDLIPLRAYELAEQFKEVFLYPESKLFDEDSFLETIEILKEVLEKVEVETVYKDEDYWHFFEAIEEFLFGERQEDNDGIYWGFSGFYDIWEDMCQSYILNDSEYKDKVIFADIDGKLEQKMTELPSNPFELLMNNLEKKRNLKPDLVLKLADKVYCSSDFFSSQKLFNHNKDEKIEFEIKKHIKLKADYSEISNKYDSLIKTKQSKSGHYSIKFMNKADLNIFEKFVEKIIIRINLFSIKIVDYKYMQISDYEDYLPDSTNSDGENKVKEDIQKQLIYEWSVQQNWKDKTQSEFWIPIYLEDKSTFKKPIDIENTHFKESRITIVGINFNTLQEYYIKDMEV